MRGTVCGGERQRLRVGEDRVLVPCLEEVVLVGVGEGVVGVVRVGGVDDASSSSCSSSSSSTTTTTAPDRGGFEEIVVMLLLLLLLEMVVDGCRRCCRLEQVVGLVVVVVVMVVLVVLSRCRRRRSSSSGVVGGHGLEEIVGLVVGVRVGAELSQVSSGPRAAHPAPSRLEVEIVLGGDAHAVHHVGFEEGPVGVREGHAEERFRVADELVDVALASHLLHDALLVVVA